MGDYAVAADVIQLFGRSSALHYVVFDDTMLEAYIDGKEGALNGALVSMAYDPIPLTGTQDVALLKRHVAWAVASDILQEQHPFDMAYHPIETNDSELLKMHFEMHMTKADSLLKTANKWALEWLNFLAGISDGSIIMPDTVPGGRSKYGVIMAELDLNISETED